MIFAAALKALVQRRHDRERGAVMIEFFLAVPIVILFAFAIIEFSLIWRNSLTLTTAAQLGARTGANAGDYRLADHGALTSTLSALSELPGDARIERIVVFNPIGLEAKMDPDCKTGPSKPNVCNVYEGTILTNPKPGDFSTGDPATATSCAAAEPDAAWCPLDRLNEFSTGFDRIGVYVEVRHKHVTGIVFPSTYRTLRDTTVMQLEPELDS